MSTLLIIILILLLVGGVGTFPTWPHSANWGYGPSSLLTVLLVIVLILFLFGRL